LPRVTAAPKILSGCALCDAVRPSLFPLSPPFPSAVLQPDQPLVRASSCQPGCGSLLQQPKMPASSRQSRTSFTILLPESGKWALHAMIKSFPQVRDGADTSAVWRMIRQVDFRLCSIVSVFFSTVFRKKNHGTPIANGKRMRQIRNEETIQKLETLAGELRAISHWDTAYWRSRRPEWYETIAFVSRQKRRGEIILQLLGSPGHRSRRAAALGKQSTRSRSKSEESKRKL
jgi:hypothetical protein